MSVFRNATAEELLSRFSDTENYPDEHLVPYQEFTFGGKTYYFTPGGSSIARTRGQTRSGATFAATSPTRPNLQDRRRLAKAAL